MASGWLVDLRPFAGVSSRSSRPSRSWDILVHRYPLKDAGPEAAPGSGYALLPASSVCAVIDTKTNFSTPATYASAVAYDLMNACEERQIDFLGPAIAKLLLVATSSRSPDAMRTEGEAAGLQVFSLGRYEAGPVADGIDRRLSWRFSAFRDGDYPLAAFRRAVLNAVSAAK